MVKAIKLTANFNDDQSLDWLKANDNMVVQLVYINKNLSTYSFTPYYYKLSDADKDLVRSTIQTYVMEEKARLQWYDRNPTDISQAAVFLGVAPHLQVNRWLYTVPLGRKCFVEFLDLKISRATAAGAAGTPRCYFILNGALASAAFLSYCWILTNTVGEKDDVAIGQAMLLFEGETLEFDTIDDSTGGTCNYIGNLKATEFDA